MKRCQAWRLRMKVSECEWVWERQSVKGNKIEGFGGQEVACKSGKKTMMELFAAETRNRRTGQPAKGGKRSEKLILAVGTEEWYEENLFSYASHETPANLRFTKYAVLRLSSQIYWFPSLRNGTANHFHIRLNFLGGMLIWFFKLKWKDLKKINYYSNYFIIYVTNGIFTYFMNNQLVT